MVKLREYQIRAIETLRTILRSGKKRPVLVLPTGAGKSVIFGQMIANILNNGKTVLWIVHRRNLVIQMQAVLKDHFGIEAGIIMSGIESDTDQPVQLCTIQSFIRRMDLSIFDVNRFRIDADIVLIDEGHRSIAKSYSKVIEYYKDRIIIACTATPMRADGRGLGEVYDSIADIVGIKELTKDGYLVEARYFVPGHINLQGVKTAMGDYVIKDLDGKVNTTKLIGDIVQNWLKLAENRKTIVYAVNVKHSKALRDEFVKNGVAAEHLDAHSTDEERDDVFNSRMSRFLEDIEDTTEFDQIDSGNIWRDENEMRFKLETFRSFMKKMGYNWNEKECTRFLEQGGAMPKKKFQNISSRHWVVALPKQTEHKNKDVKFVKAKAAWEDN